MASIQNQLIAMEYFTEHLKWYDYMCAALVGCMIAESNMIPSAINNNEKKSNNINYGAGLIQWSNKERKEKALIQGLGLNEEQTQKLIEGNGIESLSLENQLKMIVGEITKGIYKDNFKVVIEKSDNLEEAVASVYCRYINGYSSKTTIPNNSDIKRIDATTNEYNLRLKYANQVLDNYHHSIDL